MKWQVLSGKPSAVLFILLHLTISSSAWPSFHQQLASASYHEPPPSSNFQNQTADLKAIRQLLSFDNGISAFCSNLLQLVFCLLGLPVPQGSVSEFLQTSLTSGAKLLTTSSISPVGPFLKLFYSSYNYFQPVPDIQ